MDFKEKVLSWLMWLSFRWLIAIGARRKQIELSRAIRENDHEKMHLPTFKTPKEVEKLVMKTRYLPDPFDGKWDYVGSAEWLYYKTQVHNYRKFPDGPFTGDCDDYAWLFGKLVVKVDGVTDVRLLSLTYRGAAHAICSYHYKDKMYYFDYGIREVEDLDTLCGDVAERYSGRHLPKPSRVWILCVEEEIHEDSDIPGKATVHRGH